MVNFGPRLTGSPAHHNYINWLAEGMQQAGLCPQRTTQYFTRWAYGNAALIINDGVTPGAINVGDFYPYSGQTPQGGVTGQLVYVNAGSSQDLSAVNLQGKIAVFEIGPLTVYPLAAFDQQIVSTYDPDKTLQPTEPISFAWATPFPLLNAIQQAGAIGAIMLVDSCPGFVANQWIPSSLPIQGTPAITLDRDAGVAVRNAAVAGGVHATLTLTANESSESTDMLVTVIPGASDEVVILNTHTDGQNAIEESGGVILRSIACDLAKIPRSHLPRTYVIVHATGHYLTGAGGLKSTQLFIDTRPDLMAKAVAAFTVEHIGARQWIEQGDDYVSTGLTEPHVHVTTPVPALQSLCAKASRDADFRRTMVLTPGSGGDLYGEGTALNQAGVPTIQTICSPHRLVQVDQQSVVSNEIDQTQWQRGVRFAYEVAGALSVIPATQL
ncbi:hypothetical protein [Streptomyces sp. NPDC002573]|uniref:hypothetical protein n=1 Tax=Streptomyces sp. NPDC002573 TaxID=3364651 RepID=UPI00369C8DD8